MNNFTLAEEHVFSLVAIEQLLIFDSSKKKGKKKKKKVVIMTSFTHAAFCSTVFIFYNAGEKAQHIPPEKHPPYPGNMLAG